LLIVGHRGYPRRYPENTIASLLGAILYGADGVEFDVWAAGDGELVVVHDRSLRRVAGVDVDVKSASYREIARYSLGMGQHVPRLCDVVDALPERALLMVEVKDPDATRKTYQCLESRGRLEGAIILSFNEQVLRELRSIDSKVRLGLNVDSVEKAGRVPALHREIGLHIVNIPAEAVNLLGFERVAGYLKTLKGLGVRTGMWSLNSRELAERLAGLVDVAITDDVEVLAQLKG
jgi:glycerophosphoryl diester phosphodiesterase